MPSQADLNLDMSALEDVAHRLCASEALASIDSPYSPGRFAHGGEAEMPSLKILSEIMARLRAAIFPGYFGALGLERQSLRFHLTANLDTIHRLLASQLVAGLCFGCGENASPCETCAKRGREATLAFMQALPEIRRLLAQDARAAYEGDPAATSLGETIFCYPSLTAMFHQRVAHELWRLKMPLIPRIISEMAHSATGIDIHPGARIGEDFFIDHGTGVVIGETCVIGKGCRIYQGVTLGALSFPRDGDGALRKGLARHPLLEDNVTVYAGATILGRVRIGANSVIGANVWVTQDVPPGTRLIQSPRAAEAC